MSGFQLDTSGSVRLLAKDAPWKGLPKPDIYWSDLSPFAQGYVEALLSDPAWHPARMCVEIQSGGAVECTCVRRFSDLYRAALALILRRTESLLATGYYEDTNGSGRDAWADQQARFETLSCCDPAHMAADFPPLTISLSDEGKVCLAVAA